MSKFAKLKKKLEKHLKKTQIDLGRDENKQRILSLFGVINL